MDKNVRFFEDYMKEAEEFTDNADVLYWISRSFVKGYLVTNHFLPDEMQKLREKYQDLRREKAIAEKLIKEGNLSQRRAKGLISKEDYNIAYRYSKKEI